MRVWRITRRRHAAFDGEGARLYGGRWNLPGRPLVYCSEHLSLAALEVLVHTDPDLLPPDLVAVPAEIPDDLTMARWRAEDLPAGWRGYPAPETLQVAGSEWWEDGDAAVLSVPSAVIPEEHNLLLHPLHPDFEEIRVGEPRPFAFDPRLRES